jgi:hypothetical protein
MKELLLFIWQFPQNILGLILIRILKPIAIQTSDGITILVSPKMKGTCLALGRYILLPKNCCDDSTLIAHEIRISKDSKILGLFYPIFVGIPSLITFLYSLFARNRSEYEK